MKLKLKGDDFRDPVIVEDDPFSFNVGGLLIKDVQGQ